MDPARAGAGTVVDLGAGTGALSRLLVGRADEVVAVEPDDRMRAVLTEAVPGVRAVAGRGESIPLPDASVDAVIASSSWHWMDPVPTLLEVGRVLVPGGTLAAMWSGPDPDSGLIAQAPALLSGGGGERPATASTGQSQAELSAAINDRSTLVQALEIPPGVPFDQPEQTVITWDVALDADELIGLLGTFSWVILMEDDARARLFETARRALRDMLGVSGDVTVDIGVPGRSVEGAPPWLRARGMRTAYRDRCRMALRDPARGPGTSLGVLAFWRESAEPTTTDSADGIGRASFGRDPGTLIVAEAAGSIVGTVIAGWDGWRGSIYRMAVAPDHRRRGLGRALLRAAEDHLAGLGARRTHAIVVGTSDAPWRSGGRRTGSTGAEQLRFTKG